MARQLGAVQIAHDLLKKTVKQGDFCIDCTAGRGNDTALLCSLVGETGRVLAFDMQEEAVKSTRQMLSDKGYENICTVYQESHSEIDKYVAENQASAIVFNFGWLPNGDHNINTKKETSIPAIEKGLKILKKDGVMSLSIYYGKDTGTEEKECIMNYVEELPSTDYTVIVTTFVNRPNCPPISVAIYKN